MASNVIIPAIPALKDNRYLRFSTLALLYVSQGLPVGLFQVAIPAWLASIGMSVTEVGSFIAIVFLPWSFKLLAGPVMDRFTFPDMGRRRPWVLGAQAGIVLSLLLMVVMNPDPNTAFTTLAILGFLVNGFGALQDVAVDGMAIDILDEDERARANAFMFGGQIAGISLAGALGSYALTSFGLGFAALIMAGIVAVIMLVPLFLRERQGEKLLPWSAGEASVQALQAVMDSWRGIFVTLTRALILPMSLLLILLEILNRSSSGMLIAILPVLTVQELGWLQTEYSQWVALAGIAAAIFGVLLSPAVDRYGAGLALKISITIKLVMFLCAGAMVSAWQDEDFFETVIMVNQLSSQIVTIAIISLFMQISFEKVSATQFAVYMALANLAFSMGSGLVAAIDGWFDYSQMLYLAAAMNVLFLVLWPFLDLPRHRRDMHDLNSTLS